MKRTNADSLARASLDGDIAQPPHLLQGAIDSARQGKLIVIVGAGMSIGLTDGLLPSWSNLIRMGFEYAERKGRISSQQLTIWSGQLESSDLDDLLSAAEFLGRKLGAPNDQLYARWLHDTFASARPSNDRLSSAIKMLSDRGVPLCTLNYDPLLERITNLPPLHVTETSKVLAWMRREYSAILHLHGFWDSPASCILGIRDYESTQTNDVRNLFQRNLAAFNHLLFIGCGETLADPNFSALIAWLRTQLKALTPQHVALVRGDELARRNADAAWTGFVEPVSFGSRHDELSEFLMRHFSLPDLKRRIRKRPTIFNERDSVLDEYRAYLLRDCGQMTIEGISADMDTGQRKFDLERLFVPLNVSACPPEFSPSDPDAADKLKAWQKEHSESKPFGKILAKHKRLALLALPGGGKTLLLKRLAVAYAEPSRRSTSSDELPDLDLLPVLIRCREWRDHIRLPIQTILTKLCEIAGLPKLSKLQDALLPLLKKGQVLLLVDGLDEIHNDADRTTFVDHLESFIDEYKLVRVVVTSREAGFSLVAPSLSRFCERWKLAPLRDEAIALLCRHWHRLMIGESPAAIAEGNDVAETLLRNSSLRRLAENPLLLTMLLVVKHGAGGLPPDRVTLYGRAVDVLLDTWNIKGHDPLNAKEAVPQLAYVAFQLMCAGKQTATESELLVLLEEAREKHPNIRRYAKDSPYAFLKRVELRSSLLLEAGHQIEKGRTVPFYQFRHLTFQEYLTAVAATEGHYHQYRQEDTVLTPLASNVLAEEWKEVIPMVAVLARKRAEPLLVDLILKAEALRCKIESEGGNDELLNSSEDKKLSGPAGRLLQCFIEEAEASPETISSALQLISYFARGCKSADDWKTLCRGPYGEELYRQAWELLISRAWPETSWLINSCAGIAEYQKPSTYWMTEEGRGEIRSLLLSATKEDFGRGLLISMGILWNNITQPDEEIIKSIPILLIEPYLSNCDSNISAIAIWAWTNTRRRSKSTTTVSPEVLDTLLSLWLTEPNSKRSSLAAYALSCQLGIDRFHWTPPLTATQMNQIRSIFEEEVSRSLYHEDFDKRACFFVAYHSKSIWSDDELATMVDRLQDSRYQIEGMPDWQLLRKELGIIMANKKPRNPKKLPRTRR